MDQSHRGSESSYQQSNLKRSHSVMQSGQSSHDYRQQSSRHGTQHSLYHYHHPRRSSTPLEVSYPPRFAGDGLDFRRPVMNTNTQTLPELPLVSSNFIDLTGSDDVEVDSGVHALHSSAAPRFHQRSRPSDHPASRLPRFPDDIFETPPVIDLEAYGVDEQDQPREQRTQSSRGHRRTAISPEVEFISSHPRVVPPPHIAPQAPRIQSPALGTSTPAARTNYPAPPPPPIVLPANDFSGNPSEAMAPNYFHLLGMTGGVRGFVRPLSSTSVTRALQFFHRTRDSIDFTTPAFSLANVGANIEPPAPVAPVIDPLPAARPGFTRAPKEEDILICPSCHDELSVGDDDIKRQVWVVRACGHVYCGECAKKENRPSPSKRRNGKAPAGKTTPRLFSKCVVEGCGQKVTGARSMIQLFL